MRRSSSVFGDKVVLGRLPGIVDQAEKTTDQEKSGISKRTDKIKGRGYDQKDIEWKEFRLLYLVVYITTEPGSDKPQGKHRSCYCSCHIDRFIMDIDKMDLPLQKGREKSQRSPENEP